MRKDKYLLLIQYAKKIFLTSFPLFPIFIYSAGSHADDVKSAISDSDAVEFESDLLHTEGSKKIDLRRFAYGGSATPGKYQVTINVNKNQTYREYVEFRENHERVEPCLTSDLITSFNINQTLLADQIDANSPQKCIDVKNAIPDSKIEFDSSQQQLNIDVPQKYINHLARGAVNPDQWEDGIPAMFFGYYLSAYQSDYDGGDRSRTLFASINSGLNLGAWHLRHNGSYNWDEDNGGGYDANNTYLQRDIAVLRGRLTAGEYNTSGQQFTSVPFRGVQLSSDDRMLPESQRGYAPDIRGIARTNAKVTVKQQGRTIYETNVTPGEFVINDLYPSGYAGDLDVTIQESDGSIQQYSIPYASVAQLLRPGGYQYSVTAGKLRDSGVADEPIFYEMTYARGLNNIFTAYGGAQVSENYKAALIGTAIGTGMGAIGLDITQAQSQLEAGKKMSGQSYRINYSKLIDATNSDITLAAYRFSSSGYMDFLTAMQTRGVIKQGEDPDTIWRSKNRVTLSLNQGLASDWGNLYVSASMENYWNSDQGYNKQYQLGYSNTYKLVNYSVNISRNKSANGYDQTSLYLDFSMPLWDGPGARAPYVSVRYNRDSDGESSEQATLSGTVGENNKYNYNVSATHSDQAGDAANIGAGWTGSMATVSGGMVKGEDIAALLLGCQEEWLPIPAA